MGFERFGHTADLRLKVWAENPQELFAETLRGMMSILKYEALSTKHEIRARKIKVESGDSNALLVDFLNEALYQANINKEIYTDVKFLKFSDTMIEAELNGAPVDSFDEDIKAVTYHGAEIQKRSDGMLEVVLLLDI